MLRSVVNKLILSAAILFTALFIYTDGHRTDNFHGDALGYYMYLPAAFIYNNVINFTDVPLSMVPESDPVRNHINGKKNDHRTEKGIVINQYTYGVALMESPFFFTAHAYEKIRGLKANGYSNPYQYAIKIAALLYAFLGLLLTYKILRRYFNSTISLITTVVIFLGSNLFWFAAYQSGMSHVPLFFLYALLIYLTIRLHEEPRTFLFLLCGLVAGIITIIRPTDIICLLIPLLYNVYNKETLLQKVAFLKKHYLKIVLMAIVFVLPAIPQMLYWKAVSGHYLYYSYGDQSFNWTKPRILDGVLGASNGWLMYSPAMIFSLIGLLCYKSNRAWKWCLWITIPLYIYIIYCWYCYNYINGLGSRPMIHLYPLLAIPMAAFFEWISHQRVVLKALTAAAVLFLIAVNSSFTYLQIRGMLNSEESNYVFNTGMLFRTKLRYKDLTAKDVGQRQPDPLKLQKVATLGTEGFEDTVAGHYAPDPSGKSKYVYHFLDEEYSGKKISVVYNKSLFKDARWLKGSGRFMHPDYAGYFKHLLVINVRRGNESESWAGCKIENKIGIADSTCKHEEPLRLDHQDQNKWGEIYFFLKVPKDIQEGDVVEMEVWNIGKQPLYADDLKLEIFK